MSINKKKLENWKNKMDTYYHSATKEKLIKDLSKAGYKVSKPKEKN